MKERISLGLWTGEKIDELLSGMSLIKEEGERISAISEKFLKTPYAESTLLGDMKTPEALVIDFEGLDCFTFLDYVEAMRLSESFAAFKKNLKRVRYRCGIVAFDHRNHFFTDWAVFNGRFVTDITSHTGGDKSRTVSKILNLEADGKPFLPGIQARRREVTYIPAALVDASVMANLKKGDYVGIYTESAGLDVSHVGIIVQIGDGLVIRHASSRDQVRMVADEDLRRYLTDKPGLIILRPIPQVRAKPSRQGSR